MKFNYPHVTVIRLEARVLLGFSDTIAAFGSLINGRAAPSLRRVNMVMPRGQTGVNNASRWTRRGHSPRS
jgi:hypothetical protein